MCFSEKVFVWLFHFVLSVLNLVFIAMFFLWFPDAKQPLTADNVVCYFKKVRQCNSQFH